MSIDSKQHEEPKVTFTRRRLGGFTEEVPVRDDVAEDAGANDGLVTVRAGASVSASPNGKRRRRRRRPLYRRPWLMLAVLVLSVIMATGAAVGYKMESLMTSIHSVSTPPPTVTDGTYIEDGDPDEPSGPITVDTAPAREYLASEDVVNTLPRAAESGFTGRLKQAVSNSGDLVEGAAVAAGFNDNSAVPITLLVMGVDARPGSAIDIGVRPDALMIVRLDPVTKTCRALSIPRDTRALLPGYGDSKINHALMVGGIPYQLAVTESFLDIQIDHYLLIDFVAFQQIVDSLGGITVNVPEDLAKNDQVKFEQGQQFLDGYGALSYARFRSQPDGDLGRVERQWGVLGGIARAMHGRDLVGEIDQILPAIEDHMRTDLSAAELTTIAKTYGQQCASTGALPIEMMQGTRVRLHDPVLDQTQYYNVVEDASVKEYVDELLAAAVIVNQSSPATPEPATPAAATPSPMAAWRRDEESVLYDYT